MKTYTYKGKEYTAAPLNLALLASAAPMLARYRKLVSVYTEGIDTTEADAVKQRISEIETAISQLEENTGQVKEDIHNINRLKMLLKDEKLKLSTDSRASRQQKLYNECCGLAMLELIGDNDVTALFLAKALNLESINEIDLNSPEAVDLVKEIVTDFFVLMAHRGKQ